MNREVLKGIFTLKRAALAVATVLLAAAVLLMGARVLDGNDPVGFREVKESRIPGEISANVIPEYKTLERALACAVGDDIYVIVTRGEKPTSGFRVDIDSIYAEEKDGKENLVVTADFRDPDKKTAISQIITYPVQVVKTDLKRLPDTIELRIQYVE